MAHTLTHHVAQTWTCTWLSLGFAHGFYIDSSHFDSPRDSNLDLHMAYTWTRTWLWHWLTRGSKLNLCTSKLFSLVLKHGSHIDSHLAHTWTRMWRLAPGFNLDSTVAYIWTCTSTKFPTSGHLCFFSVVFMRQFYLAQSQSVKDYWASYLFRAAHLCQCVLSF